MELYEDYQSPFDFDSGVNKNYLYLSPRGNSSPPGSPTQNFGNCWFCIVLFPVTKSSCSSASSGFQISVTACQGAAVFSLTGSTWSGVWLITVPSGAWDFKVGTLSVLLRGLWMHAAMTNDGWRGLKTLGSKRTCLVYVLV